MSNLEFLDFYLTQHKISRLQLDQTKIKGRTENVWFYCHGDCPKCKIYDECRKAYGREHCFLTTAQLENIKNRNPEWLI